MELNTNERLAWGTQHWIRQAGTPGHFATASFLRLAGLTAASFFFPMR
jgi:hypothetical protein